MTELIKKLTSGAFVRIVLNWRTTLLGVAALLTSLGGLGDALAKIAGGDFAGGLGALTTNWGLVVAAAIGLWGIFVHEGQGKK